MSYEGILIRYKNRIKKYKAFLKVFRRKIISNNINPFKAKLITLFMSKRNMPFLLMGASAVLTLSSIYGIKHLPNSTSIPAPERPAIVQRVKNLDHTINQASTPISSSERFQKELDSLLATQEYRDSSVVYAQDSTRHEAERTAQESQENARIYGVGALYGLGLIFGLIGGIMGYVRANRD